MEGMGVGVTSESLSQRSLKTTGMGSSVCKVDGNGAVDI